MRKICRPNRGVHDIGQTVRVFPEITSKLGFFDVATIEAVIDAYIVIDNFGDRVIALGGVWLQHSGDKRRMIRVNGEFGDKIKGGMLGTRDTIEKAIGKLEPYVKG